MNSFLFDIVAKDCNLELYSLGLYENGESKVELLKEKKNQNDERKKEVSIEEMEISCR